LTVGAYTIGKSIVLRFFWYPTFVYSTCVCGDTAIPVVQRDEHRLGSYGNRGGKREVKGGGEEQFELLLVLIDALEEPSNLVWL
jgi:hypothetical protein